MELTELKKVDEILHQDVIDVVNDGICVSNLAYQLGKELKLDEEECYELALAGILHDIGKLRLTKYLNGRIGTVMEIEQVKYYRMHAKLGYDLLKDRGISDKILDIVLYHHENYDGTGYPENLAGDNIPFGARILRVSDVFAALIADRPYREAFGVEAAIRVMIDEVKNFDMAVFLAFQRVINTIDIKKLTGK